MLSHFFLNLNWPFRYRYRNLQVRSGAVVPGLWAGKCGGVEGRLNEVNRRGVIWIVGPLQTHFLDPPMSANRLKLNADKTELLYRYKTQPLTSGGCGPGLRLTADTVTASEHVRLLGTCHDLVGP